MSSELFEKIEAMGVKQDGIQILQLLLVHRWKAESWVRWKTGIPQDEFEKATMDLTKRGLIRFTRLRGKVPAIKASQALREDLNIDSVKVMILKCEARLIKLNRKYVRLCQEQDRTSPTSINHEKNAHNIDVVENLIDRISNAKNELEMVIDVRKRLKKG
jgi:predicted DNA-binding transcriptional regulator